MQSPPSSESAERRGDLAKDKYYLCVDCGGTKTAVTITDSKGVVRARTNGGPSNFTYLGIEGFLRVVKACVESALRECLGKEELSLPVKEGEEGYFIAAWFGVSGVDTPEAINELTPRLASLLSLPPTPPRFILANDTTLLAAPLVIAAKRDEKLRSCVAVVGGTGSNAASFRLSPSEAGGGAGGAGEVPKEIARVGGWGWILGDEGGGFHIGRETIRQLLRQHELAVLAGNPLPPPLTSPSSADGGEGTRDLRTSVLDLFGVNSAVELLALIHDADPVAVENDKNGGVTRPTPLPPHRLISREKRLSQLPPLVLRAAFGDAQGKGGGDSLALNVLKTTSTELAEQITLLLEPPSGPEASTPLAIPARSSLLIFGGSLVGIPNYQNLVLDALRLRGHEFVGVEHVANAAEMGGRVLWEIFNSGKGKDF